ncbi:MAG: alpha-amylase family glycosyl hydrolase [Anaerolineales bacterium]
MPRKPTLLLILTLLFASCAGPTTGEILPATPTSAPPVESGAPVFYEIFVRSFYDSNGDGVGDFNGMTQKLDYIQALGVSGVWLMPIFPSPSYHGYDVTDYYNVNADYGTMEDFKNFLSAAHQRNIRVIIDLPLNHTSDKHAWFKEAKNPNSPYRNWYIWKETDPKYNGPWGQDVWHPSMSGFYYGIFTAQMPDLNYRNDEVTAEMLKVTRYWLTDVGVDGYRLDAVKHLIEQVEQQQNTIDTHIWLKDKFYPAVKAANPSAYVVGELFGDSLDTISLYTKGKQFDAAFHFQLADAILKSINLQNGAYLADMLQATAQKLPPESYAPFITNHDQDRAMNQLYNKVERAKLAAFLLLTSPGTPFIYYGEEIGMTGKKPDEDIRRPMQWSAEKNAGFSTGKAWRAPAQDYEFVNVSFEEENADSLLNHYRSLIQLRNERPVLYDGSVTVLQTSDPAVYAVLRQNENETLLILANLKNEDVSDYQIQLEQGAQASGVETLFGGGEAKTPQGSEYQPFGALAANSMYILKFLP